MIIEVGKKYVDYNEPEWIGKHGTSFLVKYPSGNCQDLLPDTIEALYKPFEEEPCVA